MASKMRIADGCEDHRDLIRCTSLLTAIRDQCQDIGLMFSNKAPHLVQHSGELAARRLGVAIDLEHHVRSIDRHLLSTLLHLASRARDSSFDLPVMMVKRPLECRYR